MRKFYQEMKQGVKLPNIIFTKLCLYMSPVPPVFYTGVIVSIGLKNKLRVGTFYLTILRPSVSLFGKQDWVKTGFQIEVLILIQNLMEN